VADYSRAIDWFDLADIQEKPHALANAGGNIFHDFAGAFLLFPSLT